MDKGINLQGTSRGLKWGNKLKRSITNSFPTLSFAFLFSVLFVDKFNKTTDSFSVFFSVKYCSKFLEL